MKKSIVLLFLVMIGSSLTVFAEGDSEPEQKSSIEMASDDMSVEVLELDVLFISKQEYDQVVFNSSPRESSFQFKADHQKDRLDKLFKQADEAFDRQYSNRLKKIRQISNSPSRASPLKLGLKI